MISYQRARQIIVEQITKQRVALDVESVELSDAHGRVLALDVLADRDYPPFDRSTRDGYAVRAADVSEAVVLTCVGEIKAGDVPSISINAGECLQIMTGAAVPSGADAVVMIEHTSRVGDAVTFSRAARVGQNFVRRE